MSSEDNGLPIQRCRSRTPPRRPTIQDCLRDICVRGQAYVDRDDITKEDLRECLRVTVRGVLASQMPNATVTQVARAGRLSRTTYPNGL